MRISGKWMVLLDDRILEFLQEEGPKIPSKIANDDRIHYGDQYVGDRCRKLSEYGLLENIGNGVYVITEQGKQYLAGDLDASELEAPGETEDARENSP